MEVESKKPEPKKFKWPGAYVKKLKNKLNKDTGKKNSPVPELIHDTTTVITILKIFYIHLRRRLRGTTTLIDRKSKKINKKLETGFFLILKAKDKLNIEKLDKETLTELFLSLFKLLPYVNDSTNMIDLLESLKMLIASPHAESLPVTNEIKLALGFLKQGSTVDPMYVVNKLSTEFQARKTIPEYVKSDLDINLQMFNYMKLFSKKHIPAGKDRKGKIHHLLLIRKMKNLYKNDPTIRFKFSDPKIFYDAWILSNLTWFNYKKIETFGFFDYCQSFYDIATMLFEKDTVMLDPGKIAQKISFIIKGRTQSAPLNLAFDDFLKDYAFLGTEIKFYMRRMSDPQRETFVKQLLSDQINQISLITKMKMNKEGVMDYSELVTAGVKHPDCFHVFLAASKIITLFLDEPTTSGYFAAYHEEFFINLLKNLRSLLIIGKNLVLNEREFTSLLNEDLKILCNYMSNYSSNLNKEVKAKFLSEIIPSLICDQDATTAELFGDAYSSSEFVAPEGSTVKIAESIMNFASTNVFRPGDENEIVQTLEDNGFFARLEKFMVQQDDADGSYYAILILEGLLKLVRGDTEVLKEYFTRKHVFINILLTQKLNEETVTELVWNTDNNQSFIFQLYGTLIFSLHPKDDRLLIDRIVKNFVTTLGKLFFQAGDDELNKFSFRFHTFIKQCPDYNQTLVDEFYWILIENFEKIAIESAKLMKSNPVDLIFNQWEEKKNLEGPLESVYLMMHCFTEVFNTKIFVNLISTRPMAVAKDLKNFIEISQLIIESVLRAFNVTNRFVRRTLAKPMLSVSCSVFALSLFPIIQYLEHRRSTQKDLPENATNVIENLIIGTLIVYSQSYSILSKPDNEQDDSRTKEHRKYLNYIKYKENTLDDFIRHTAVPVLFVEGGKHLSMSDLIAKFNPFWMYNFPEKYDATIGVGVLILKLLNATDVGFEFNQTLQTLNMILHLLSLFNQQPDQSLKLKHLKTLFKEIIEKNSMLFVNSLERLVVEQNIKELLDPEAMVDEELTLNLNLSFIFENEGDIIAKVQEALPELKCITSLLNVLVEDLDKLTDFKKSASVISVFAKLFDETPESILFFCVEATSFSKLFHVIIKNLEKIDEKFFEFMITLLTDIFKELFERVCFSDNYIISTIARIALAEMMTGIQVAFSKYHPSLIEVQTKFEKIKNIQTFTQIFSENRKYLINDRILRIGFVEFEIIRVKFLKYWADQVTDISLDIMYYFPNYYNFLFDLLDIFSLSVAEVLPANNTQGESMFYNRNAAVSVRRKPLIKFDAGNLIVGDPEEEPEEEGEEEEDPSAARLSQMRRRRRNRRRAMGRRMGFGNLFRNTARAPRPIRAPLPQRRSSGGIQIRSNSNGSVRQSAVIGRTGSTSMVAEIVPTEEGKPPETRMESLEEDQKIDNEKEVNTNASSKEMEKEGEGESAEENGQEEYDDDNNEENMVSSLKPNEKISSKSKLKVSFMDENDIEEEGEREEEKEEGSYEEEEKIGEIQYTKEDSKESFEESNSGIEKPRQKSHMLGSDGGGSKEANEGDADEDVGLPEEFKKNLDLSLKQKVEETLKKPSRYSEITLTYEKFFSSLDPEIKKEIKQRRPEDLVNESTLIELRRVRKEREENKEDEVKEKKKFKTGDEDDEDEGDEDDDEKKKIDKKRDVIRTEEAKDFLDIAKEQSNQYRTKFFRGKYELYERLIVLIRFSEDATGQIVINFPSHFLQWLAGDDEICLYFVKILTSLIIIDHQQAKALLDKSIYAEEDSPFKAVFKAPFNPSSLKMTVFHLLSELVGKSTAGLFFMPSNEVLTFQENQLKGFKALKKHLEKLGKDMLFGDIMKVFLNSKDVMTRAVGVNYGVALALKIFEYPTVSKDERARKYLEDQSIVLEHILTMVIERNYILGSLVGDLKAKKDFKLIRIFLEKIFKFAKHLIHLLHQIFPVFKNLVSKIENSFHFNTFNKIIKYFSGLCEFFLKIFEILNDEIEDKSELIQTRELAIDSFVDFFQNDSLAQFMSELTNFMDQADGIVIEALRNISFEDLILIPIYLFSGKLMLASQKVAQKKLLKMQSLELARTASIVEEESHDELMIEDIMKGENEKTRALIDSMLLLVKKHGKSTSSIVLTKITEHFSNNQTVLRLVKGLVPYEEKVKFFRNRIYLYNTQEYTEIEIKRKDVLKVSMEKLNKLTEDEMKGEFSIVFLDEDAYDAGGPEREWFTLLSKEFTNPKNELFVQMESNQVYQPKPVQLLSEEKIAQYEFIGVILGKVIMSENENSIDCYFPRSFYKHLLGSPITIHDVNHFDPKFFEGIMCVLKNDVSEIGLTFSFEDSSSGQRQLVDMIPDGRNIEVAESNKKDYIRRLCYYITTQSVEKQIQAIVRGFRKIVPKQSVNLFNAAELELLISGLPDYDVEDMRLNAKYEGFSDDSQVIKWLWDLLRDFDKIQKANFLQFVTGSSKAPIQGFKSRPIKITRGRNLTDQHLPSAFTWYSTFNFL